MMQAGLRPATLEGKLVRLEPLSFRHVVDLEEAGSDEAIWRWLPSAHHKPGAMRTFVDEALRLRDAGAAIPFAIVDVERERAVGSTRYHYIEPVHRRLEIGVTWIALAFQRTYINTESKLVLLRYAFERLAVVESSSRSTPTIRSRDTRYFASGPEKRDTSENTCSTKTAATATASTTALLMTSGRP
jgi:RimJ/RimL family protein N-acetyltransferase